MSRKRTGLWGLLFPTRRRRSLPNHLVTRFRMQDATPDEQMVFYAGRARDRHYIRRLMERHKAKNAVELLKMLPRRRPPTLWQRIVTLMQRYTGALPYDPTRRMYREYVRGRRQPYDGFHVNELTRPRS